MVNPSTFRYYMCLRSSTLFHCHINTKFLYSDLLVLFFLPFFRGNKRKFVKVFSNWKGPKWERVGLCFAEGISDLKLTLLERPAQLFLFTDLHCHFLSMFFASMLLVYWSIFFQKMWLSDLNNPILRWIHKWGHRAMLSLRSVPSLLQ